MERASGFEPESSVLETRRSATELQPAEREGSSMCPWAILIRRNDSAHRSSTVLSCQPQNVKRDRVSARLYLGDQGRRRPCPGLPACVPGPTIWLRGRGSNPDSSSVMSRDGAPALPTSDVVIDHLAAYRNMRYTQAMKPTGQRASHSVSRLISANAPSRDGRPLKPTTQDLTQPSGLSTSVAVVRP